jgi:hypothetical protein
MTSIAIFTNATWPLVTVPHIEVRTREVSLLADLDEVILVPLVNAENRLQYENYAVQNQGWLSQSLVSHFVPFI